MNQDADPRAWRHPDASAPIIKCNFCGQERRDSNRGFWGAAICEDCFQAEIGKGVPAADIETGKLHRREEAPMGTSETFFTLDVEATTPPPGARCATCRFLESFDVHYSGPPKIVHYCKLKCAGPSRRAHVTRLKWVCRHYDGENGGATIFPMPGTRRETK